MNPPVARDLARGDLQRIQLRLRLACLMASTRLLAPLPRQHPARGYRPFRSLMGRTSRGSVRTPLGSMFRCPRLQTFANVHGTDVIGFLGDSGAASVALGRRLGIGDIRDPSNRVRAFLTRPPGTARTVSAVRPRAQSGRAGFALREARAPGQLRNRRHAPPLRSDSMGNQTACSSSRPALIRCSRYRPVSFVERRSFGEGFLVGQQFIDRQTETVDVRAYAEDVAAGLLGRHGHGRGDDEAGRETYRDDLGGPGEPKVHEEDLPLPAACRDMRLSGLRSRWMTTFPWAY